MGLSAAVPLAGRLFKKPKEPELPPPPPPPAPEAVVEATQSSTQQVRKRAASRFGRRNTVLAGTQPLGNNPNRKTLLGQ